MDGSAGPRFPPFASVVHGVRWTTLAVGLALAPSRPDAAGTALAWGFVLLVHATWRTLRPAKASGPRPGRGLRGVARLAPHLADAGVVCLAVAWTGYWQSPFAFCLLSPLVAAGFGERMRFTILLASSTCAAVTTAYFTVAHAGSQELLGAGQWVSELMLVAALASYARRLFGEAERRHSATLSRVSQLAEANDLLVSLHRLAQTLPASLNLDQVLVSSVSRLRSVIACDVVAVVVRDDATGSWAVQAGEGTRLGRTMTDAQLPPPLAAATSSSVASLVVCLEPGEGLGPEFLSHSGLYAPLRAQGRLVGLIALEHHEPGFYGRRDLQLLDGMVEGAALAIDNARWFARLRAIGADEERVRIARDMHDRVGQSLAGVAFAIDRAVGQATPGPLRDQLDQLRQQVRGALGEVRETLADLRTEVSDERGMVPTMEGFLDRVTDRGGLTVRFDHAETGRLSIVQEREMWRIAQEAVTNVERHASARRLTVGWRCDGVHATLTVADDGRGFAAGDSGRPDSYGMTGMRERADGIGATLAIDSSPGRGTMVQCVLGAGLKTAA